MLWLYWFDSFNMCEFCTFTKELLHTVTVLELFQNSLMFIKTTFQYENIQGSYSCLAEVSGLQGCEAMLMGV